jgi:hypothetical protein
MRISESLLDGGGSKLLLMQNAEQDPSTLNWTSNNSNKDSFLIEMVDSSTNQGYISIQHAPKYGGELTWTEVFRINYDGSIILNKVTTVPDAPGADILKIFSDVYIDRLVAKMKTASETVNLVQGVGMSRIIHQDSFPGSAKDGDILIKPGVKKLRYGEIYVENNSTPTTISGSSTWYQVTVFGTNGLFNDTTPDHSTDDITIDHAGVYLIVVSAAIKTEGGGSGAVYEVQVEKNDGATSFANIHTDRQLAGGGGDVGSISLSGIVSLSVDDTIELWVQNKSNTDNIIFEDATLSVIEIK